MKFISYIWGYHEQLYHLSSANNYHLHALLVAKQLGLKPVAYVYNSTARIENDPNFDKDIEVVYYSNFLNYIWYLWINRKNVYYANTLVWKSLIVGVFCKQSIFMAHDSVVRKTRLKQVVQNFLFKCFARIRVVSNAEKNYLVSQGLPESKIFVVRLSINVNNFFCDDNSGRIDLLWLGNVTPDKNIKDVLLALSLVKAASGETIKLHIFGAIRELGFQKLVNDLCLTDNVVCHGFISHQKLPEYIKHTLIYVNSSISEGQCLASLEASIAGNVLCLPALPTFVEVFKGCALFHEIGDFNTLAQNIQTYMRDVKLRLKHVECAQQIIKSIFDEKFVSVGLKQLFTFK